MLDCEKGVAPANDESAWVTVAQLVCSPRANGDCTRHIDIYWQGQTTCLQMPICQSVIESHLQRCGAAVLGFKIFKSFIALQVIYLVRDVWRGLSAKGDGVVLPGGDKGFQRSLKDLTLTRCALPDFSLLCM